MKHLVQFSTGAASAEVAWRVVAEHGAENVTLLTADTLNWGACGCFMDGNPTEPPEVSAA